jgi:O-methyltransferase
MSEPEPRALYLKLLKASVRNDLYRRHYYPSRPSPGNLAKVSFLCAKLRVKYRAHKTTISHAGPLQISSIIESNRPDAHTLASRAAVDNVQFCVENALAAGIDGDLIETGVYRGGLGILMRGVLKAWGETERKVYCADSWEGLPAPGADIDDAVAHDVLKSIDHFAVSLESVKQTFARYGLLDDQVVFLKGWFAETLPNAAFEKLAVARLDGDYYESTRDAIQSLYPKLQIGGWLIVDDYGLPVGARRAIDEYRHEHSISEPMLKADHQVVYWQKNG